MSYFSGSIDTCISHLNSMSIVSPLGSVRTLAKAKSPVGEGKYIKISEKVREWLSSYKSKNIDKSSIQYIEGVLEGSIHLTKNMWNPLSSVLGRPGLVQDGHKRTVFGKPVSIIRLSLEEELMEMESTLSQVPF
jgi:hypothetical protein